jgi:hypothetical protein
MTPKKLKRSDVKEAIRRVRRELQMADIALDASHDVECMQALERAQHRAFDAKALFLGHDLPDENEVA